MPISSTCDHAKRTISTVASEILSCQDVLNHIEDKVAQQAMPYAEIFDARGVTLDLSLADLHRIAAKMKEVLGEAKYGPTAVVTTNNFIYGLARTYGELTAKDNPNFSVFQDPEEARHWIASLAL